MKKKTDLGTDRVGTLVLKLAIPTMIAQLVNVLYCIIDRMYIGNIPKIGDVALAGAGVCGPIITLLSSFGTLIGLGGSILMAMRLGEGKKQEAKTILSNCFLMLCLVSLSLTVVFLLTKRQLLFWFGASDTTFVYANTYLTIYTFGTFFALLAVGLNYFITCQGFSFISMSTVLIGAFTNIVLDYVFIFLLDMGIAGAAYATVIAQIGSCIFAMCFLFGKKTTIAISFGGYSMKLMRKVLALGAAPFLILASDSIIIIALNAILQHYGGAKQGDLLISAATIVQSYFLLITGPLIGITGGTQAIISYNYGAARIDRVKRAQVYIVSLCLVFTTAMFLISQFLPMYFVTIFTQDIELTSLSVWGMRTFALGVIPLSFQYAFVDGLTAMGRTKTALLLSALRKSMYVAFTVFLPMFFMAKSAFYAEPISDIISATISCIVYIVVVPKYLKKRKEMVS